MRVLLESPSFHSSAGSNGGVGYGWAAQLAREAEVHIVCYEPIATGSNVPEGTSLHPIARTRAARAGSMVDYHLAARRARAGIVRVVRPDVVHSVEPGGWIGPRAFATDDLPYVLGPLNGGAVQAPRALSIEVMNALPVHPVKNMVRGGPKAMAVNLLNEAVFGSDLPTAKRLGRAAIRKARRVVLATEISPGAIADGDRHKVVRVPLVGVDLELFRPRIKHQEHALQVVYAGRITPSKGLHLLIEALARTGATLVVAGPAQELWYEQHCRALADRLGIAERITWLGAVPRRTLPDVYGRADVYVMPSLWEPYGMTYIEAMACGTPVVGLATGGVPEVIAPGTGWLLRPTNRADLVEQIADRIAVLSEDRAQATMAGDAARGHAQRTWRWDRLVRSMLSVYADAIG